MTRSGTDTIAAIATPLGEGGISVIRISGTEALAVGARIYAGKADIQTAGSHTAHFGKILDPSGNVVDEVVVTVFKEPNSYTGENTVEVSCHGGILVTKRILELALERGARLAEPGEFTKRAFLNGKMDLSQAEAVADLIHARSDVAHRASVRQLEGVLSERIRQLRAKLVDSIGLLELELDFAEEDLEFVDKKTFQRGVLETVEEIEGLLATFSAGRIYREGVKVVIAGPPNAGKSSLLNILLSSDRAIVTDIPGTTRDTIEEAVHIGGISFRLVDTAGLRETEDIVEREGVRRTEDEVKDADVVVFIVDASRTAGNSGDGRVGQFYSSLRPDSGRWLFALNKSDLPTKPAFEVLCSLGVPKNVQYVEISAKSGAGLDKLREKLLNIAFSGKGRTSESSATVTSTRHYDVLRRAKDSLVLSLKSLEQGQSGEFVAVDLRNALDSLGEITGEVTTEEILNNIFSKFCIGK